MPSSFALVVVPAAGEVVAALDRLDQRLDRLVGGLVREVPRGEPVRVAPQAVLDRLVLEQRVEDVGAGAQAGLERGGDGLGGLSPLVAVRVEEPRERDVERDRLVLALEVDAERRGQLVEQAGPGAAAGDRELGRDLLLGLREEVVAVAPLHPQVVAGELHALGGQQLLGAVVGDLDPLELEEQELGLDRGAALGDHLHQRAVGRVLGVGGEAQVGEVRGAAGELGDLGDLLHRLAQAGAVEVGDLALVGRGELVGERLAAVEQGRDDGLVVLGRLSLGDVEQVAQVPGDLLDGAHPRRLRRSRAELAAQHVVADQRAGRAGGDDDDRREPPVPALLGRAAGAEGDEDHEADAVDRAEDVDEVAVGDRRVEEDREQQGVGDRDDADHVEPLQRLRPLGGVGVESVRGPVPREPKLAGALRGPSLALGA